MLARIPALFSVWAAAASVWPERSGMVAVAGGGGGGGAALVVVPTVVVGVVVVAPVVVAAVVVGVGVVVPVGTFATTRVTTEPFATSTACCGAWERTMPGFVRRVRNTSFGCSPT